MSFMSHEARLADHGPIGPIWIYERRLWREPFSKRHCLFGSIAGIWNLWTDGLEAICSFAILTDHESPIELKTESQYEWLAVSDSIRKPRHWVDFLRDNKKELNEAGT